MSACWDRVVRASGALWRWFEECRLGFTKAAAVQVLRHRSGKALEQDLRERWLPSFQLLRDWVYVVLLLEREERGEPSLHQWVKGQNGDPAMYYRCVKRVTGLSWREVKARGSAWARAEACRMWGPYLAPSLPPSLPQWPIGLRGKNPRRRIQENMAPRSHNGVASKILKSLVTGAQASLVVAEQGCDVSRCLVKIVECWVLSLGVEGNWKGLPLMRSPRRCSVGYGRIVRHGVLPVLIALVSGCGGDRGDLPEGGGPAVAVTVSFAPWLRVADGDSSLLARPIALSENRARQLFIGDRSDRDIKVYDAAGVRIGTIGRKGSGPGEFASLMSAHVIGDSLIAYDLATVSLSLFSQDGRFGRTATMPSSADATTTVGLQVVDDSLLLAIGSPMGAAGRRLLTLLRSDGTVRSRFFDRTAYIGNNIPLSQRVHVTADARAGVVFALLDDSLFAFTYEGDLVGRGLIDPDRPLPSVKNLLAANSGRPKRPDGTWVVDSMRKALTMVALSDSMVAVQTGMYSATVGMDPIGPSTILLLKLEKDGAIRLLARTEAMGGLVGRDHEGTPVVMGYDSSSTESYRLFRLIVSRTTAGVAGGEAPGDNAKAMQVHATLADVARARLRGIMRQSFSDSLIIIVVRDHDCFTCEDLGRQLRELQSVVARGFVLVAITNGTGADRTRTFLTRERVRVSNVIAMDRIEEIVHEHAGPFLTPAVLVSTDGGKTVNGVVHPGRVPNVRRISFADQLADVIR